MNTRKFPPLFIVCLFLLAVGILMAFTSKETDNTLTKKEKKTAGSCCFMEKQPMDGKCSKDVKLMVGKL